MIKNYLRLARIDHWVKNVFVIPGALVVLFSLDNSEWFKPSTLLNFFLILSDKKMETLQVFIKTELEDDMEENVVENSHLLPRETPCQEPIKSER